MHPFASVLVGRDIAEEAGRRAEAEVRAMYARPDALPLPPEPESVGIRGRLAAVVRRVTADPAPAERRRAVSPGRSSPGGSGTRAGPASSRPGRTIAADRHERRGGRAGRTTGQERERLVQARADVESRQWPVHHLADRPLDDGRIAVGAVKQTLLADRADDADDLGALGRFRHRQLADPVGLERRDGRRRRARWSARRRPVAVGARGGDRRAAPRRGSRRRSWPARALARIHSSL